MVSVERGRTAGRRDSHVIKVLLVSFLNNGFIIVVTVHFIYIFKAEILNVNIESTTTSLASGALNVMLGLNLSLLWCFTSCEEFWDGGRRDVS